MAKVFIGTSGYSYSHWKEIFYPKDLKQKDWFSYYAKNFNTLELNVSFYNLPRKESFAKWNILSPDNFKFSVKGPRVITHFHKLEHIDNWLETYFERASGLENKFSISLWQFPPSWKFNAERFKKFCIKLKKYRNCRHAFEFRNITWFQEEVYTILKNLNASIVLCDWPFKVIDQDEKYINRDKKIISVPKTSDFIYLRRHGTEHLYTSLYSMKEIELDSISCKKWLEQNKDVYIYFNNDAQGNAVKNAFQLKKLLNL